MDDLATQDFSFTAGSPATKIGFKPIPFDQIGLRPDQFREQIPWSVYAPSFRPSAGAFRDSLAVHILPTPLPHNPKCVVRYTLDGSEPRADSPADSAPITIRQTTTLKAAAFVTDGQQQKRSQTVSATYSAIKPNEYARSPVSLRALVSTQLYEWLTPRDKDAKNVLGNHGDLRGLGPAML